MIYKYMQKHKFKIYSINNCIKITKYIYEYSIVSFCLLLICLLIYFSKFNNPSSDDFVFFSITKNLSIADTVNYFYKSWSGRYSSFFLAKLFVNLIGTKLIVKFLPIFLFLNLLISTIFLFEKIFTSEIPKGILVYICFFIFIYLTLMPSIPEGVYWFSSIITYSTSLIFFIWLIYFSIKFYITKKNIYFILIIIFIMFTIGSNETIMLILDYILFLIWLFNNNIEFKKYIIILLLIAFSFTLIVYLAPGNSIRSLNITKGNNFLYACFKTLQYSFYYIATWIIVSPFILFFSHNQGIKVILKIPIKIAVFFLIPTIFIGFFASFYSTGNAPPGRVMNILFFIFLISNFILLPLFRYYLQNQAHLLYVLSILFFSFHLITSNNIKNILVDLKNNNFVKFNYSYMQREIKLQKSRSKSVKIVPLGPIPLTLYFDDIDIDSKNWKNSAISNYYNLDSIILKN